MLSECLLSLLSVRLKSLLDRVVYKTNEQAGLSLSMISC